MKKIAGKSPLLWRYSKWHASRIMTQGSKKPLLGGTKSIIAKGGTLSRTSLSMSSGGPLTPPPPPPGAPLQPRPSPPRGQGGQGTRSNSIPSTMLLYTTTGDLVHIRFIESINFEQDEEEEIVGKLAADQIIKIRTTSGKEYEVSIREMIKLDQDERDVGQMVAAIRGCFQRQES